MVSLCDTHWGNFNKYVKFVKMARVERVNLTAVTGPYDQTMCYYTMHVSADPNAKLIRYM
jgi:hypothetical protein